MRKFLREIIGLVWAEPVEWLLKPGVKAVVVVAALALAAQVRGERSLDRKGLAALAATGAKVAKDPALTGSLRRP